MFSLSLAWIIAIIFPQLELLICRLNPSLVPTSSFSGAFLISPEILNGSHCHQVTSVLSPQWHSCHLWAISHFCLLQTLPLGWREVLEVSWTHTHIHTHTHTYSFFCLVQVVFWAWISFPWPLFLPHHNQFLLISQKSWYSIPTLLHVDLADPFLVVPTSA